MTNTSRTDWSWAVLGEDFDNNELLRLSLTHLLQIIGEAARRVSPDFRENYPTIPWQAVVGMRSKVVHDYLNIDEDIVWNTVKNDLPFFITYPRD